MSGCNGFILCGEVGEAAFDALSMLDKVGG